MLRPTAATARPCDNAVDKLRNSSIAPNTFTVAPSISSERSHFQESNHSNTGMAERAEAQQLRNRDRQRYEPATPVRLCARTAPAAVFHEGS